MKEELYKMVVSFRLQHLLTEMGFHTVIQCKSGGNADGSKSTAPTNVNVMNYLKHVVPKMFQV
jgi:hypothetical protein